MKPCEQADAINHDDVGAAAAGDDYGTLSSAATEQRPGSSGMSQRGGGLSAAVVAECGPERDEFLPSVCPLQRAQRRWLWLDRERFWVPGRRSCRWMKQFGSGRVRIEALSDMGNAKGRTSRAGASRGPEPARSRWHLRRGRGPRGAPCQRRSHFDPVAPGGFEGVRGSVFTRR